MYFKLGQPEKARAMATKFADELLHSAMFYLEFYAFAKDAFELCGNYIYYLSDVLKADGEKDMSAAIEKVFSEMVSSAR